MKNLILIDANSLIHRCFHALPPLTGPNNQPAGALYGLSSVLIKILREQKPDYIAAFFDRPEPTFRKEIFNDYKIHRPKAPDELISQIIEARNLVEAFGIKFFEAPGFEADDLIGSAAEKFKTEPDLKIIILTGDLDSLQLVEKDRVVAETFKKGISETIIYNEEAVKERYGGLLPSQIADYKGLVGDPSDNIPGVMGIGPKTAAPLIKNYGSLENFLGKGDAEKNYEKIVKSKDIALLSKKLAVIRRDAPLDVSELSELKYNGLSKNPPAGGIESYFEKLGFISLIKRIQNNNIY
ncbi:MAG: 5'-3' exonuclease H3TH domain-containing protein [Patescibacteria group bacterium]|mgnify:FL=1